MPWDCFWGHFRTKNGTKCSQTIQPCLGTRQTPRRHTALAYKTQQSHCAYLLVGVMIALHWNVSMLYSSVKQGTLIWKDTWQYYFIDALKRLQKFRDLRASWTFIAFSLSFTSCLIDIAFSFSAIICCRKSLLTIMKNPRCRLSFQQTFQLSATRGV